MDSRKKCDIVPSEHCGKGIAMHALKKTSGKEFRFMKIPSFQHVSLEADFCVVGGGVAGICAAVAAARHGAKTILVQDRPVLGGNASSECRMWICGAVGKNMKETGILEELQLENLRYNPALQYNLWDHILINFVQRQKNLTLLLNCSCDGVEMESPARIRAVTAWQLTTEKRYTISAKYFADCSGDSVLRVSGAEFRKGREAASEFGESYAPEKADEKTMGNSILIQTRETGHDRPFEAPPWAHVFEEKGFHRGLYPRDNFWWIEYGGELDTIADAEEIRDELLKIVWGVWDLVKNSRKGIGRNFDIEWVGILPGKRENIRYIGDHILTQTDIEKQGRFDDLVAYGGWTMDDHNPAAFYFKGEPTIHHPAPSPYGIPFRCLYSRNIDNLYFAGRNISTTHMALSSTRVMGTGAVLGQAAGTAAAIGVRENLDPRGIYEQKIEELQNTLMDDDAYLPWHKREIPKISRNATLIAESEGDVEILRNGVERGVGDEENCFSADFGSYIEYHFAKPTIVNEARIVFDSDLRDMASKRMPCHYPEDGYYVDLPETLVKEFTLKVQKKKDSNEWKEIAAVEDNFQRLVRIPVNEKVTAVRLIPEASWGAERARIFSFDLN